MNSIFPYYFHVDDKETEITAIRIYGLNDANETVCLRINNFTPYIYIEIKEPQLNWTKSHTTLIFNKIDEFLGPQRPLSKSLVIKHKLYGAHFNADGTRKLFPFLYCTFSNKRDIEKLSSVLYHKKKFYVSGIGYVSLKIHEQDADPILQLVTSVNIPTAGWVNFMGTKISDDEKVTIAHHEYKVKWKNMVRDESKHYLAKPKIMGFDIEANSSNPTVMPDAERSSDKIFQISCVFAIEGDTGYYQAYILSLGQPDQKQMLDDKNSPLIVLTFETEADLLVGFTTLIRKENPNIIVGYNIAGFDFPYMIRRSQTQQVAGQFDMMSFHKYYHSKEREVKWSSKAYKNQKFKFLDAEGRLIIDLLPLIKRDYKLNNYRLKTVSEYFLGAEHTKDPLSVKGIFKCYRMGTKRELDGSYGKKAIKAMSIVGKYCIQDSALMILLMRKLETWTGLVEMAKTTNCPISTLYLQGQQIKVYSQVYKYCFENNIVVEKDGYVAAEGERYVGAHVFPPVPGIYNYVVPFDFSSLYPTTIIAYNIDYSTIVFDENIPDSKCHVMRWSDHISCNHDPKVIRKATLTTYIDAERKKLKALREKRDKKMNHLCKNEIKAEIKKLEDVLKPYIEERSKLTKTISKNVMCAERYYRFLKEPKGVLPTILQNLLDARKNTRKEIKQHEAKIKQLTDEEAIANLEMLINVLDKRQLSFKISANSVPYYTPILCRRDGKYIFLSIEDISDGEWFISGEVNEWFIYGVEGSDDQEVSKPKEGIEVWSDKGFTKPKFVMRHYETQKLRRVSTRAGVVDCTKDHSLLREDGNEVTPDECQIGDKLLYHYCFDSLWREDENYQLIDSAFDSGRKFAKIVEDDVSVPEHILNGTWNERKSFLNGYSVDNPDLIIRGFLKTASMLFLLNSFGYKFLIQQLSYKCFKLVCCDSLKDEGEILNIEAIQNFNNFVYDIETENHHFHAGIGSIIVHNSMYGALGVPRGYLPLMPAAMSCTYMGRTNIEIVAKTIPEKYGGQLVYGDSVSADTPILVRFPDGTIDIRTIETLSDEWSAYEEFKPEDSNRKEKQQARVMMEVFANGKWATIKRVIRHKTTKRMFRVNTHIGVVDVSEDHSLLDESCKKVKPTEIEIGSRLLHSFPVEISDKLNKHNFYGNFLQDHFIKMTLPEKQAFVWGFFMGDGNCGEFLANGTTKYWWEINHESIEVIEQVQMYLEKIEPYLQFKIVKSSRGHKLICVSGIHLIVEKYQHLFYSKDGHKKVPFPILNGNDEIIRYYLIGYCHANGWKPKTTFIVETNEWKPKTTFIYETENRITMDSESKIGAQGLYYLLKSIGYECVSIDVNDDVKPIYRLEVRKNGFETDSIAVKKIIELPSVDDTTFIYDLETSEGIFHAGVGELNLKNTDSNYISFPHITNAQEMWDYAIRVADEISALFPKPIKLEFENVIYAIFFILTKKRYMYNSCKRDGIISSKVGNKGVLLARRDSAMFVRKLYEQVVMKVFAKQHRDDILYFLLEEFNKMFSHSMPYKDFVITKSVGTTNEMQITALVDSKGHINPKKIKIGDYTIAKLPSNATERAKKMKLKDASTPEEYYRRSLPAPVYLAEKMKSRGQIVQPGTRLEYVVTNIDNHGAKQLDKVEDIDYFLNYSEILTIDYFYYLSNSVNPIDEVLNIAFGDNKEGNYKYKFKKNFVAEQYNFRYKIRRKVLEDIKNLSSTKLVFN